MPNQDVSNLIARRLGEGLTHPGDGKSGPVVLPLPMFRATTIPRAQAEHFAAQAGLPGPNVAQLTGEAIVHSVEQDGWAFIRQTELEQLREAAAGKPPPSGRMTLQFSCNVCHNRLFRLNVDVNNPAVNGPHLLEQLSKLTAGCPHTPEATA
ncbi:hypothetical protein [Mycobacterium palustre]|uniref:Uncharacterized protein n=1 Tax=Mycobacterium palustre TaxID=153971 RepID=A0A1X1ZCE0_9MYCO|nr:hypothetical protein [Mycobacterium palustre]MCV7100066.1 hypothetical protein [Mycobacterium palustre]ORW20920.1 hypothetical protein AWC19_14245 [Mycobacterium palustre]